MKRYKITNELKDTIKNCKYCLDDLSKLVNFDVKNVCYKNKSISKTHLNSLKNILNLKKISLEKIEIYNTKNLGIHAIPKRINKPTSKSIKLAEFVGIMLGDGCVTECYSDEKKQHFYAARVSGHSEDDFVYLIHYVTNLMNDLFGSMPSYYKLKHEKEINLCFNGMEIVKFLNSIGLKSGNKKENNQGIPDWIFEKREYMIACLRGLIDTDGSVCPITGKNYSCIWFKSAIPKLRESFSVLVKELGIITTNWSGKNTPQIYVCRKNMIRKYFEEIGFSNPKHI
ncbi:hypothetical protein K8R33_03835, partial [archaeon]|nr:hypothetical protein [archaeon]